MMTRLPWGLGPQASTAVIATVAMLGLLVAASLTLAVAELVARQLAGRSWWSGRSATKPARRFYVGRLGQSGPSVFVVDSAVRPLAPAGPAPRRFGWGSVDQDGGVDLAHSMLRDVSGVDPAPAHVRRFAGEVVCGLDDDGFVLAADSVQRWLSAQRRPRRRAGVLT